MTPPPDKGSHPVVVELAAKHRNGLIALCDQQIPEFEAPADAEARAWWAELRDALLSSTAEAEASDG